MPADLLLLVESVLRSAAVRFPRSAMLQLYVARFYQVGCRTMCALQQLTV